MEHIDVTLGMDGTFQNGMVVTQEAMARAVAELAGHVGLIKFGPERELYDSELADIVNFGPSVSVGEDGVEHINSFDIIY